MGSNKIKTKNVFSAKPRKMPMNSNMVLKLKINY